MTDEQIFDLAETHGWQDDFGRWNFKDDGLLDFVFEVQKAEREAIMDEWYACVQSDFENGVRSLNERAAEKWHKEYPAIARFADTIQLRGKR